MFETSVQNEAIWSLDRIDQAQLPLDNRYSYATSGKGVDVYVLDSGVRISHFEFGGRARCGYNAFEDTYGTGCDDTRGHGTHVA